MSTNTVEPAPVYLDQLVTKIRDFANHPRKQSLLVRDAARFSQLCSAMDAIGDSEYAILAHAEMRRSNTKPDVGSLYLFHYGLMQALYLQQDAASHLCQCLGLPKIGWDKYPALREVRDVRNDVAHPTNRGQGQEQSYLGIIRASMTINGFELYSFSSPIDGRSRAVKIRCEELERAQHAALVEVLSGVVTVLNAEEMAHKDKYRSKLLVPLLGDMGYALEKVHEAVMRLDSGGESEDVRTPVALVMLESVGQGVGALVEALKERDWYPGAHEGLDELVDSANRVIERLRKVLNSRGGAVADPMDAVALAHLLKEKLNELRDFAAELDEDYNS